MFSKQQLALVSLNLCPRKSGSHLHQCASHICSYQRHIRSVVGLSLWLMRLLSLVQSAYIWRVICPMALGLEEERAARNEYLTVGNTAHKESQFALTDVAVASVTLHLERKGDEVHVRPVSPIPEDLSAFELCFSINRNGAVDCLELGTTGLTFSPNVPNSHVVHCWLWTRRSGGGRTAVGQPFSIGFGGDAAEGDSTLPSSHLGNRGVSNSGTSNYRDGHVEGVNEARIGFVTPRFGSVLPWGAMVVELGWGEQVIPSELHPVRISVAGQSDGHLQLTKRTDQLTLGGVEPGTHSLMVEWMNAEELQGSRGTVSNSTIFDVTLSAEEILHHRVFPSSQSQAGYQWDNQDVCDESQHEKRALRQKTRICFVGLLKNDGQRSIWLRQMEQLDKDEFDMVFLTFASEEGQDARHDKGHDDIDSVMMERMLKALGIPLVRAGIPRIKEDDLLQGRGQEVFGGPESSWPPSMDEIMSFAVEEARMMTEESTADPPPPLWVAGVWEHIVSHISELSVDVVVFGNGRSASDALLAAAAKAAIGPTGSVVMELPNLFPWGSVSADVFVAPSHYAAAHFSVVEASRSAGAPVVIIPPGVNTSLFRPQRTGAACHPACPPVRAVRGLESDAEVGCHPGCLVVGFMARLAPEKSPGLFLQAAAVIASKWPLCRFRVIGSGPLRAALEALTHYLGISQLVEFTGMLHGEDLSDHLRGIDVIVNPTLRAWSETFCIANVEAMACGIPVVSFGVGGVGDYLTPQNGVLVDEASAAALADAVIDLLHDDNRRRSLGEKGRRTALDRFSDHAQGLAWASLYRELVAKRRAQKVP